MTRSRLAVAAIAAGLAVSTTTLATAASAQPQSHLPHSASAPSPASSSATAAIDRELAGLAELRRSLPKDQQHLVDELKAGLEAERARLIALTGGSGAPAAGTTPSFFGQGGGRAPAIEPRRAPGPDGARDLPGESGGNPLRREQSTVTAEDYEWTTELGLAGPSGRRTGTSVVRDGFGFRIVPHDAASNDPWTRGTPATTDRHVLSLDGAATAAPTPRNARVTGSAGNDDRPARVRVRLFGARAAEAHDGTASSASGHRPSASSAATTTRRSDRRAPVTPRPAPGPGRG